MCVRAIHAPQITPHTLHLPLPTAKMRLNSNPSMIPTLRKQGQVSHAEEQRAAPVSGRSRERTVSDGCQKEQNFPGAVSETELACGRLSMSLGLSDVFVVVRVGALTVGVSPFQRCDLEHCHGVPDGCSCDRIP